jgi:hypothetical protein
LQFLCVKKSQEKSFSRGWMILRRLAKRAKRNPWADAILQRLLQSAETLLTQPLHVPDRGAQWVHWYACPNDGVELVADSATRHRCPHCGATYSGEPYDSVYVGRIHNANSAAMQTSVSHSLSRTARSLRRAPANFSGVCEPLHVLSAPR